MASKANDLQRSASEADNLHGTVGRNRNKSDGILILNIFYHWFIFMNP